MQKSGKTALLFVGAPIVMLGLYFLFLYSYVSFNSSSYAEYADNDVVEVVYAAVEDFEEEVIEEEKEVLLYDGVADTGTAFVAEVVSSGEVLSGSASVGDLVDPNVTVSVSADADGLLEVRESLAEPVIVEEVVDPAIPTPAPVVEDLADAVAVEPTVDSFEAPVEELQQETEGAEKSQEEAKNEAASPVVIRDGEPLELVAGRVVAEEVVAVESEKEAVEKTIDYSDYDRAVKLYEASLYPEVLPYLNWQVENNPENLDARTKLRLSHRALGSKEDLESFYLGLLERYPANTAYTVSLGTLYMSEFWDFVKAREMYEKALELDPGNEAAVYNLELIRQIESGNPS